MKLISGMGRRGVLATGLAALAAGCQQPDAAPAAQATAPRLSPDRTGYILVAAPLVNVVRDLFVAQVNKLLDLNAAQIYVLMASPGGAVSTAQDMIAFMDKTRTDRRVTFTTHNVGTVASAACYVFLAGQRRLSVPRGTFLFHELAVIANGAISSQTLQEASVTAQRIERSFLAMLTAKTKLSEAEALSFVRRTVILNTDEARRDGIINSVADFALPAGATIYQIRAVPKAAAPTRRPETGAGG